MTDQPVQNSQGRPLPVWMIAYALSLPLQVHVGYGLVPSDFFAIVGIAHLFLDWCLQRSFTLDFAQAAFLAFLAFSLVGRDIGLFPSSYGYELASLSFLFLVGTTLKTHVDSVEKALETIRWFNVFFVPLLLLLFIACFFRESPWTAMIHGPGTVRLAGLFQFANQLAIFLVGAIPLALINVSRVPKILRIMFYMALFLILSNIGSRSSLFIAIWQIFMVERYLVRDSWSKIGIVLTISSFLAIGIVLFLKQDYLFVRAVGQSMGPNGLFIDATRALDFGKMLNIFPDWWVTGVGLGCYKIRGSLEIHNIFLSACVEAGMIGGICFGLSILGHWQNLLKVLSHREPEGFHLGKALFISFQGLLMMGMVHNIMRNRFLWWLIGLISGLAANREPSVAPVDDQDHCPNP